MDSGLENLSGGQGISLTSKFLNLAKQDVVSIDMITFPLFVVVVVV